MTNPDAPLNLQNVPSVTLATQIGLKWTIGVKDGGSPVSYYRVSMFDPAKNSYDILQSRIPVGTTTFTATGLTAGSTYKFNVQSENDYDFSDYSNEVVILAA